MSDKYNFNEEDFSSEGIAKQRKVLDNILISLEGNTDMPLENRKKALEMVKVYMTKYEEKIQEHKKFIVNRYFSKN
jgi:hypothetical protein